MFETLSGVNFIKTFFFEEENKNEKKGCPYGTHRVISPKGVLPQPADVIDNTMEIYDNEVLIDVKTLNVDSASFTEIVRRSCDGKKPADIENSPEDQEK